MADKIEIKVGVGTRVYTKQELRKELEDLEFFRDAFLMVLNEEVAGQSFDIPFSKDKIIEFAREKYNDTSFSKEFIDNCFRGKLKIKQ